MSRLSYCHVWQSMFLPRLGSARARRDSYAQALFASMAARSAVPSIFSAAAFSGAALSVASVQIEDEDGTVFAGDLDRLAGGEALVEQVETRFPFVGRNPFAEACHGGFRRHSQRETMRRRTLYGIETAQESRNDFLNVK